MFRRLVTGLKAPSSLTNPNNSDLNVQQSYCPCGTSTPHPCTSTLLPIAQTRSINMEHRSNLAPDQPDETTTDQSTALALPELLKAPRNQKDKEELIRIWLSKSTPQNQSFHPQTETIITSKIEQNAQARQVREVISLREGPKQGPKQGPNSNLGGPGPGLEKYDCDGFLTEYLWAQDPETATSLFPLHSINYSTSKTKAVLEGRGVLLSDLMRDWFAKHIHLLDLDAVKSVIQLRARFNDRILYPYLRRGKTIPNLSKIFPNSQSSQMEQLDVIVDDYAQTFARICHDVGFADECVNHGCDRFAGKNSVVSLCVENVNVLLLKLGLVVTTYKGKLSILNIRLMPKDSNLNSKNEGWKWKTVAFWKFWNNLKEKEMIPADRVFMIYIWRNKEPVIENIDVEKIWEEIQPKINEKNC